MLNCHRRVRVFKFLRTISPSCSSTQRFASQISAPLQESTQPKDKPKVIFSGIQPTGVPHLGNYLGALRQWVDLQNSAAPADTLLYSIVDLHAITTRQDPARLRIWRREALAALLAIGLDPDRCILFYQSEVPEHAELMWILSCTASMGYLSRMTQWKSKLSLAEDASPLDSTSTKAQLKLGLFSYPVLQAADVLLYDTTHIPVGMDQAQHLEFARDLAESFNAIYGPLLVEPQTLLSPAKRVMSLREPTLKMSKSHQADGSRIHLNDDRETIRDKIRLALTDSITGVSFDPQTRPGVSNLLSIMSYLDSERRSPEELAHMYSSLSMKAFKDKASSTIMAALHDIREKYLLLIESDNGSYLDEVAREGARKARLRAEKKIAILKESVGLDSFK